MAEPPKPPAPDAAIDSAEELDKLEPFSLARGWVAGDPRPPEPPPKPDPLPWIGKRRARRR